MGKLKAGLSLGKPKIYLNNNQIIEDQYEIQKYNDEWIRNKLNDLQHEYSLSINKTKEFFEEKTKGLLELELKLNNLKSTIPDKKEIEKINKKSDSILLTVEDQLNKINQNIVMLDCAKVNIQKRLLDLENKEPLKQEIVKTEIVKELRIEEKLPNWAKIGLITQAILLIAVILLK